MNPVEKFYKGSTVLVTGATGFLGSVLVEKILRCFEVKKIYLLVRTKNGISVDDRLEQFKEVQIFDLLRKQRWAVLEKLVVVEVDYNTHDLSIDPELLEKILSEVEVRQRNLKNHFLISFLLDRFQYRCLCEVQRSSQ